MQMAAAKSGHSAMNERATRVRDRAAMFTDDAAHGELASASVCERAATLVRAGTLRAHHRAGVGRPSARRTPGKM
jgi:hypothetical protein